MKVPELFHHLEYFDDNDYKRFLKFLKSPYHNYYLKSYSDILRIIKRNNRLLTHEKSRDLREIILKSLKCSEKTTLTILSRLGDLVLDYFRIKAMDGKQIEKEYILCEYLLSIGYYKILDEKLLKCCEIVNEEIKIEEDTYLKYFQIGYLRYRYSILQDSKILGDHSIVEQQNFTLNSTKDLFVFSLVRFTINYLNYTIQNIDSSLKNTTPYPLNLHNMFEIVKSHEFKSYDNHQKAIIMLYYYLFLMFKDFVNDKAYEEYRNYFFKVNKMFNNNFSNTHFSILINYCNLRQRVCDNDGKYNIEGLKLLSAYIDQKMYVDEQCKYLLPILYRNFVINCNIPNTKSLLKSFIDKETQSLHTKHRKDMMNFGNAYYHYLNKENGKALKCILDLKHPKFMYKYDIRNLELKIYYDKKHYNDFQGVLHNYHENIKAEPMFTKNDKKKYTLMIDYFDDLMKIDEKYGQDQNILPFEYLLKNIISEKAFVMKQWFVDKIKSIIKTHFLKYGLEKSKQQQ